MIRACLDSNVFVSGLISSSGAPYEVLEALRRRKFLLITAEDILMETERVLNHPHIKTTYSLTPKQIKRFILTLRKHSLKTSRSFSLDVVKEDPQDNKILACAVEGKAAYIITGDAHLRNLGAYRGIIIISPRDFAKILKESTSS